MNKVKYLLVSVLVFLLLTGCGASNNDRNNASPTPDTNTTDNMNNGDTTNDNGNNMVDDAADAVGDVGNGVADGVKDVGRGISNGVNSMTGNNNNR